VWILRWDTKPINRSLTITMFHIGVQDVIRMGILQEHVHIARDYSKSFTKKVWRNMFEIEMPLSINQK
jgi:hypothetical protein